MFASPETDFTGWLTRQTGTSLASAIETQCEIAR